MTSGFPFFGVRFSISCDFCHLAYMSLSPILSYRVLPVMHLKILIVLSRRLMMIVSALVAITQVIIGLAQVLSSSSSSYRAMYFIQ